MEGEASVFAYILPPALLPLKSPWLWEVTDPWALGQQSQWLMLVGRSAACKGSQGSEDPVQIPRVRAFTHPFRSFHPPHHTEQKIGYVVTCVKRLEERMRPSETGAKGSFPSHRSWSADTEKTKSPCRPHCLLEWVNKMAPWKSVPLTSSQDQKLSLSF